MLRCLSVLTLQPSEMNYALQNQRGFLSARLAGHSSTRGPFGFLTRASNSQLSIELPQHDRKVAVQLDKGKLERSNEKFQEFDNCMCRLESMHAKVLSQTVSFCGETRKLVWTRASSICFVKASVKWITSDWSISTQYPQAAGRSEAFF